MMWLKLKSTRRCGVTFCRQRFYRDDLPGMCLTGAERDQVQGGGSGPGRRCWNALKSNRWLLGLQPG